MSDIKFRFKEKSRAETYVFSLSQKVHVRTPEIRIKGPFEFFYSISFLELPKLGRHLECRISDDGIQTGLNFSSFGWFRS